MILILSLCFSLRSSRWISLVSLEEISPIGTSTQNRLFFKWFVYSSVTIWYTFSQLCGPLYTSALLSYDTNPLTFIDPFLLPVSTSFGSSSSTFSSVFFGLVLHETYVAVFKTTGEHSVSYNDFKTLVSSLY